jgi:magnesium transporter
MLRILVRRPDGRTETASDLQQAAAWLGDPALLVWIDAEGEPSASLDRLTELFDLHPVTRDDFLHHKERPKIEEFERYTFVVVQAVEALHGSSAIVQEVHLAFRSNALLTVHERPLEALAQVFARVSKDPPSSPAGPCFLVYLISDALVEAFFPLLDRMGEDIDALEDAVLGPAARAHMPRIFALKRLLLQLRKIVSPQREVYNALSRRDSPFIDAHAAVYFRDVHDHWVRAYEMLDSYRDLVANTLDAYLATVSNRLGQVMKQLTVIATIFMPLSFLTGFFGMNFSTIPYAQPWLFAAVLLVMAALPLAMLVVFVRRGWLREDSVVAPHARERRQPQRTAK